MSNSASEAQRDKVSQEQKARQVVLTSEVYHFHTQRRWKQPKSDNVRHNTVVVRNHVAELTGWMWS